MNLMLLFTIVKSEVYTIRENRPTGLALTITDDNVGFTEYDPTSPEQKIEFKDGALMRNDKRVCASPNSSKVKLCASGRPNNANFELIQYGTMFKVGTRGSHVLVIGDYNSSTEMYDANVIDERKVTNYWFIIEPRIDDFLYSTFETSRKMLTILD
ncbi:uncharacterized protein VICG_00581 [Vittaforma corneae ATCC 50505]|uniref:Uncharacterized protein n=1 Tax=Vittaforma corneae (strain ATCC 50505) TaxID=993615 RepID=L2GQ77_VITCO|nr:uncharacterized protein VICG_00581 [Vittaforma corneae ATCC 50505]ELA42482.1 hypothetical protein VICG_00581 [Vittaforma corneae ATCC 50505]